MIIIIMLVILKSWLFDVPSFAAAILISSCYPITTVTATNNADCGGTCTYNINASVATTNSCSL